MLRTVFKDGGRAADIYGTAARNPIEEPATGIPTFSDSLNYVALQGMHQTNAALRSC